MVFVGNTIIQQRCRITNVINESVDEKKDCIIVFIDVSHSTMFGKRISYKKSDSLYPFHTTTCYKCNPASQNQQFRTRVNGKISEHYPVKSGVPHVGVLGPYPYLTFTADIPTTPNTTMTFEHDTATPTRPPESLSRVAQKIIILN